jgi:hypothetical protein
MDIPVLALPSENSSCDPAEENSVELFGSSNR